jgi:hypothetical protein
LISHSLWEREGERVLDMRTKTLLLFPLPNGKGMRTHHPSSLWERERGESFTWTDIRLAHAAQAERERISQRSILVLPDESDKPCDQRL